MRFHLAHSLLTLGSISFARRDDGGEPSQRDQLLKKWGTDWAFSGISTFAHLPYIHCLTHPETTFDIGVIGAPFDTAVSYRPGARFGPRAIRASSARQISFRGFNPRAGINPYKSWAEIIDCGDIPITPFDNKLALQQMSAAYVELGKRAPSSQSNGYPAKSKLLTLGGDHSIVLPALRALHQRYKQPISVLHFDAHLDTWHPAKYPSAWIDPNDPSTQSFFNHGSMFWLAGQEGLIANGSSVHAGLRTRLAGTDYGDFEDDAEQGWYQISADDIDTMGTNGIIELIAAKIGTQVPVYVSVDIDVIDPGMAPGTGTPEPGGWTTRELICIVRGLETLNVVGADIVEVSPPFDNGGEVTSLAAAQIAYELLTNMVKRGLLDQGKSPASRKVKDEL